VNLTVTVDDYGALHRAGLRQVFDDWVDVSGLY